MVWATTYNHYDALGSTTNVTDSSESVTGSYRYAAYGDELTGNLAVTPFLFVGRMGYYFDLLSGQYYIRSRTYASLLASFISRDPLGVSIARHIYGYADNRPLLFVDPSGNEKCCCCVEDLTISEGKPFKETVPEVLKGRVYNVTSFGHEFTTTISLSHTKSDKILPCGLYFGEWSDGTTEYPNAKPNEWYDVVADALAELKRLILADPNKEIEWRENLTLRPYLEYLFAAAKGDVPCDKLPRKIILRDKPAVKDHAIGRILGGVVDKVTVTRNLYFYIVVVSGTTDTEVCKKPFAAAFAHQRIVLKNGQLVEKDSFFKVVDAEIKNGGIVPPEGFPRPPDAVKTRPGLFDPESKASGEKRGC